MSGKYEKLIGELKRRRMDAAFFETKEELLAHLKELVPEGATVTWGGSVTLGQTGVIDMFRNGPYKVLDRADCRTHEEAHELMHKAFFSDYYFMSSNAVTEDGKLVNIDGNGNRVAALIYGPANVVVIVGTNKIVKDEAAAMDRVKNLASPMNSKRLNMPVPCVKTGKCEHCVGEGTICCHTVISRVSRQPGRIKVYIVNEVLGF